MIENSSSKAYADAGVDITAGYRAVELMKKHIAQTVTPGVCSDVGGFGGLFALNVDGMKKPALVSGTDGVGTKLKLAFLMDKHDAKSGNISEHDMFNTFNMGVGMSIVVSDKDADKTLAILKASGEDAYIIGRITRSDDKVTLC